MPIMTVQNQPRRFDLTFFGPDKWGSALRDAGEFNYAFLGGIINKRHIDPVQWCNKYTQNGEWRCYIIHIDRVEEYTDRSVRYRQPSAVYPVWHPHHHSLDKVQEYIKYPWKDRELLESNELAAKYTPIRGQAHKIFLQNIGNSSELIYRFSQLQIEHPEIEFVITGTRSYNSAFGTAFRAAVINIGDDSRGGSVWLANGKMIRPVDYQSYANEIGALGYRPGDLAEKEGRWAFNVMSARVAADTWNSRHRMTYKSPRKGAGRAAAAVAAEVLSMSPADYPLVSSPPRLTRLDKESSDMLVCNSCSLWRRCSAYQEGSMCAVNGSQGKNLADHFGSQNADLIVQGMGSLLRKRAERVESLIAEEDATKTFNYGLDIIMSRLFKDGATLAKMLDPKYARPLVEINNGDGSKQQITAELTDPRGLAMQVVKDLEDMGYKREEITEKLVDEYLNRLIAQPQAIEAEVIEGGQTESTGA